jgi:hypothetical protein
MPSQDGTGTNVLIYFKIAQVNSNGLRKTKINPKTIHSQMDNFKGSIHMKIQVNWDVTAVDS